MAQSFCNGCKFWVFTHREYFGDRFKYCSKLVEYDLKKRKEMCGGKYKENNL